MLEATQQELDHVLGYMGYQAPDLTVEFAQKIYSENVLDHRHDVWDVHTNVDRWWVITNPTNLYSQAQFPNMDLAVTFHVGLCLRMPRSEKTKLAELPIEPFAQCYRYLSEASDALRQAQEVADYQAIGVRCREALLHYHTYIIHACSVLAEHQRHIRKRQWFRLALPALHRLRLAHCLERVARLRCALRLISTMGYECRASAISS